MPRYSRRLLEAAGMLVILALTAAVLYVLLFYPGDVSVRQAEDRRVFGAVCMTRPPYYQVLDNCLRAELEANGAVLLTRDALAGHEDFTILASGESDGQIENAMPVMEDLLRQALEADVLMALNDPSAFGGLAAIEGAGVASACRPDVVLMDVRMPGMDGVEGARLMKERWPDMKVVVLTTFDDEYVFGALAAALLAGGLLRRLEARREPALTVGSYVGSYWQAPNGDCYQILDDAVALLQEKHPGVWVEYVSGIPTDAYSEWLAEQILKGTEPDAGCPAGDQRLFEPMTPSTRQNASPFGNRSPGFRTGFSARFHQKRGALFSEPTVPCRRAA